MTFTGYAIELEKREELNASSTSCPLYSFGDLPERVDPRRSQLAEKGWLQVEDQMQQGSCQGQALTECLEYCYAVATGAVEQFSRQYAYLLSQKFDGINGDRGSTLSGGTKAVKQGICRESVGPYAGNRYPGLGWMTATMHEDAKNFRLKSHTDLKSVEAIRNYIGAGAGIVQIGIMWGGDMDPDANGCIRRFSGNSGGGHSVVICGYLPDSDVGQRSSAGYWLLLKNSWSKRWGKGGYAYWDPTAVASALKHRFSVFIGRSDMETPNIRPVPHDFTKKGITL